jgi:hypothetical protein
MQKPPLTNFLGETPAEIFSGLPPFIDRFEIPPSAKRELVAAWGVVKRRHFSENVTHSYPWNFFTAGWKAANGIPANASLHDVLALCLLGKAVTIRLADQPAVPEPEGNVEERFGVCRDPVQFPNDIRYIRDTLTWFFETGRVGNFGLEYGSTGITPYIRKLPVPEFPTRPEYTRLVEAFEGRGGWWYPIVWARTNRWGAKLTRYVEYCNFPATIEDEFPTVSNTGWVTERYWTFVSGCCCC